MKDIWLKHKLLIIIFIGIAIILAVIIFLVMPVTGKIKSVADQIQEKILDQQVWEARLGKLSEMEENWLAVEAQKESLDVILGSEKEISFIEGIESIAVKTGNAISLKIGDNADPKEIAKIKKSSKGKDEQLGILDEVAYANYFPMQINLKGNYQGLVDFIHLLENSRFYINVVSIEAKKEEIKPSMEENIFSNQQKKPVDSGKKEIINTNINAIVYTKN